jgi:hypothetical protein
VSGTELGQDDLMMFARLRRCGAEIVESRFLISCRMDGLSDLIDWQIGDVRR